MRLFHFYRKGGDPAEPDSTALEQAGESGVRHAAYQRRIVLASCLLGAIGAGLGVVQSVVMAGQARSVTDVRAALAVTFTCGIVGVLLGVALACLFAPREFLTGPLGEQWMKLIGTKSVLVARILWAILGLVFMAVLVGFGLSLAFAK
jgi:hypothetical protein